MRVAKSWPTETPINPRAVRIEQKVKTDRQIERGQMSSSSPKNREKGDEKSLTEQERKASGRRDIKDHRNSYQEGRPNQECRLGRHGKGTGFCSL